MKRLLVFLTLFTFLSSPAFAFLYEVKILTKEELQKISNDELSDLYTSALIEREASETFHGKAGFTPKEYSAFKELLGLIVRIRREMQARELDAPPVDDWLRRY